MLNAVSQFLSLGFSQTEIREILKSEVFSRDAKTGVAYAEKQARDTERSKSAVMESEMTEVEEWITQLARVSEVTVPVGQTLNQP